MDSRKHVLFATMQYGPGYYQGTERYLQNKRAINIAADMFQRTAELVTEYCEPEAEIVAAFCRLRREGRIDDTQYRQLKSLLLADIEDAAMCDLNPEVLARSIDSLEANVLRGMDAIHVGSAIALKVDVFISADQRQLEAAIRAGLRAERV